MNRKLRVQNCFRSRIAHSFDDKTCELHSTVYSVFHHIQKGIIETPAFIEFLALFNALDSSRWHESPLTIISVYVYRRGVLYSFIFKLE